VGLATEVRNGGKHSLLVFVKVASEEHLFGEVYRSRYVTLFYFFLHDV
jgi:anoctamin-10